MDSSSLPDCKNSFAALPEWLPTWRRLSALLPALFFGQLATSLLAQVPPPVRPDAPLTEEIQGYVDDNHLKTSADRKNRMEGSEVELSASLLFGKNSTNVIKSIAPLAQRHKDSVFRIVGEHRPATLGTVVSADGYIIVKLSELDRNFVCVRSTGQQYLANVVGRDSQRDLAVIQISANDLTPIDFSTKAEFSPGDLLFSPGFEGEVLGLGIVGVDSVDLDATDPPITRNVVLGINVSQFSESVSLVEDGKQVVKSGVRVNRVEPRTAGEESEILVGDLILDIDGKGVTSPESWNRFTSGLEIGQELKLGFVRNGKQFTTTIRAKCESNRTIHDRWGGGPFSNRRFGLGQVIIHDTVIRPEDCGGPLVNLDGQVIGINIARTLRVASFAIPNKEISAFLRSSVPNIKLKE